jgi:hypothetical protein
MIAADSARGGFAVSGLAAALLVVFAVATCTFYIASGLQGQGSPWARDVCALSPALCSRPAWALAATGVVGVVYLALRGLRL